MAHSAKATKAAEQKAKVARKKSNKPAPKEKASMPAKEIEHSEAQATTDPHPRDVWDEAHFYHVLWKKVMDPKEYNINSPEDYIPLEIENVVHDLVHQWTAAEDELNAAQARISKYEKKMSNESDDEIKEDIEKKVHAFAG